MISLRPFAAPDAPALAALMTEMARGYGAAIRAEAEVAADILAHARSVEILLACDAEGLAGFATFATLFPVGAARAFTYIQQLYVGAHARRLGVARCLLAGVARAARSRGCARVEWATGTDNAAARALYDGLGAVGQEKLQYVLEGEALERLATG
jgi:GNAT superfamily N-acetyltransferase